jgi:hypothetical protein
MGYRVWIPRYEEAGAQITARADHRREFWGVAANLGKYRGTAHGCEILQDVAQFARALRDELATKGLALVPFERIDGVCKNRQMLAIQQ